MNFKNYNKMDFAQSMNGKHIVSILWKELPMRLVRARASNGRQDTRRYADAGTCTCCSETPDIDVFLFIHSYANTYFSACISMHVYSFIK